MNVDPPSVQSLALVRGTRAYEVYATSFVVWSPVSPGSAVWRARYKVAPALQEGSVPCKRHLRKSFSAPLDRDIIRKLITKLVYWYKYKKQNDFIP